ncbi:hypothetical protein GGR50DRAFT_703776 [Xylaria sp. CBS 124048]|nr:hypothetical protein GGR50DRAFT_703776 [Xylaria sp. CBS 124048]
MSFDGNANMESAKIDNANTGKITGGSTKIDNANAGKVTGGSTVNSSPPVTPLSTTTFNTLDTAATTPVYSSFHNSPGVAVNTGPSIVTVHGMPYAFEHVVQMGQAVADARRKKRFPATTTPGYNLQAIIDDYEDLQRLDAARQGTTRTGVPTPEFSRLYVEIQRKIQDRDLTHGEVAAEANVRARISGLANGTAAETGLYNLMRHAVNSVLRRNNLTLDSDESIVEAVASRVVQNIRANAVGRAANSPLAVEGVNMESIMEDVFNAIEQSLGDHIAEQAKITNDMSGITDAQSMQLDAVAGHVKAIDSHVHAMGNNLNAMSCLVNSTNGNLLSLNTNVGTLQAIINMIPQMVANSVREQIPEMVQSAVHGAVQASITDDVVARFELLIRAIQGAQARASANANGQGSRGHKVSRFFGKLNIFKKRFGH